MLFGLPTYHVLIVWRKCKSQIGSEISSPLLGGRAIGLGHFVVPDLACSRGQIGPP